MHQSPQIMTTMLPPAETLQVEDGAPDMMALRHISPGERAGLPSSSWQRALDQAEAELDRPVMRRLFWIFAALIAFVYLCLGVIVQWAPGA